jgi:magnesium transporter
MTMEDLAGDEIRRLLDQRRWHPLRRALADLHPADAADLLGSVSDEEETILFRLLGRRRAEVFAYLPLDRQRRVIETADPGDLAAIVTHMPPDDRTRLLEELPPEIAQALLARLPPSDIKESLSLLSYGDGTAGRLMTPDYVAVAPDMTAAEALLHIRTTGKGKETLDVVYVVDARGRLVHDIPLGALVLAEPETRVTEVAEPALVALPDTTPAGEALREFEKYDRVALPVIDRRGHMLGIITIDDVLDVAETESTREMHRLGGLEAVEEPYQQVGFWSLLRKRGGWLSVLFIGEMLTTTAMAHYEEEIARAVILALFVPLIISSGGNSGSQATSLIIRALALRDLRLRDWWRVLRREVLTGLALGAVLGGLGFARVAGWHALGFANYGEHNLAVATAVCASLIGVVTFGTVAGSMLPFLMRRLGLDPATSSAPFVATLVDVTGLVIYFQVAALLLRGRLL